FRRAHDHKGAALVEIYQNCNVFNNGAFDTITSKANRDSMLIPLVHGEPLRFGPDGEKGVVIGDDGRAQIVDVAEVGEDRLVVHDELAPSAALAFTLAQIASGPHEPTPVGVFRAVERPEYAEETNKQLALA